MTRRNVETGRDRAALVADAGLGPLSPASVVAGVLVAYGAFVILGGLVGGLVNAAGLEVDLVSTDYEQLGIAGGLIAALVLFLSYLFGGYVAGRMARRRGVLHGVAVLVLGVLLVTVVAALTAALNDGVDVNEALRNLGIPTTADQYGDALTVAGIAALAALVLGAVLGGKLGEQWHGKLIERAVDPTVGTEAEARERARRETARAEEEHTRSLERASVASPRTGATAAVARQRRSESWRRRQAEAAAAAETRAEGAADEAGPGARPAPADEPARPRVEGRARKVLARSRTAPDARSRTAPDTGPEVIDLVSPADERRVAGSDRGRADDDHQRRWGDLMSEPDAGESRR